MRRSKRSLLATLARAFDAEMFEFVLREHRHIRGESFRDVVRMYHDFPDGVAEIKAEPDGECDPALQQRLCDLLTVYVSESSRPVAEWASILEPWDNFVEKIRSTLGTPWVSYRIAKVAASGLPPAATPVKELHLLDQALPLCSRAVSARRFADDAQWWESCLREASNLDEIAFVIMMMLDVAGDSVVRRNLEMIDTALEKLPNNRWTYLFGEFVHFLRPPRSPKRIKIPETDLPVQASARLCALLALRSNADSAAEIYKKRLLDYAGEDIHVWSACIDLAIVAAQRRRTLWPQVLLPVRRGYDQGALPTAAASFGLYARADETLRMPIEVAEEICKNADLYPLVVLDRAETTLQVHVGENRTSISEIARRDRWFDANP
jgi:hypothetical protein